MLRATIVASALLLASCGGGSADDYDGEDYSEYMDTDLSSYEGEEKGGETYEEYDARRDSYQGEYGNFEGHGCTEDCSGHEAGYAWAEKRGIEDPDNCGGNSWSFEEGCRAYAEEQGGY